MANALSGPVSARSSYATNAPYHRELRLRRGCCKGTERLGLSGAKGRKGTLHNSHQNGLLTLPSARRDGTRLPRLDEVADAKLGCAWRV